MKTQKEITGYRCEELGRGCSNAMSDENLSEDKRIKDGGRKALQNAMKPLVTHYPGNKFLASR